MKIPNPIKLLCSTFLFSGVLMASVCDEQIPTGNPTEALTSGEVRFNITNADDNSPKLINSISVNNTTYSKIMIPNLIVRNYSTVNTTSHFVTKNGVIVSNASNVSEYTAEVLNSMKNGNLNNFTAIDGNVTTGDSFKIIYDTSITSASNRFVIATDSFGNNSQTLQALDAQGDPVGNIITISSIQVQGRVSEYLTTGITVSLGGTSEPLYAAVYPLTALLPSNEKIYGFKVTQDTIDAPNDGTDGKVFVMLDEDFLQCTVVANNDDLSLFPLEIGETSESLFLDNGNGTDKSNLGIDAIDEDIDDNIVFTNFDGLPATTMISTDGKITIENNTQSGIYNPTYRICLSQDVNYCDTATVMLAINNKPITNEDTDNTDQGLSILVDVTVNDIHLDNNETLTLISAQGTSNGTAEVNGTNVLYTPNTGFFGEDTFTYIVEDSKGNQSEGNAIITVVQAPDISLEDASIPEGGELVFRVNVSHPYRADIELTFNINDITTTSEDYNGTGNNLKIIIPASSLSETYVLTTINDLIDEGISEELELSILTASTEIGDISDKVIGTIIDNDISPEAVDDYKLATYGTPEIISVLLNDIDGTLPLDETTLKIVNEDSLVDELIISGEGIWSVNEGTIVFTSNEDYVGDPKTIKYEIRDEAGNLSRAKIEVNYPPLAVNDEIIGTQNEIVIINVLENDRPTTDQLDETSVQLLNENNVSVDSLYIINKGTFNVNKTTGSVEFQPDGDFIGVANANYTVKDTNGDVSNIATITAGYPKLVDDIISGSLGGLSVSINVIENDADEVSASSVKLVGGGESNSIIVENEGIWSLNESTVTFTPNENFYDNPTPIQYIAEYRGVELDAATISVLYSEGNMFAEDDLGINISEEDVTIDVLENDSFGLYGAGEEVIRFTNPEHGRVILNDNGTPSITSDDTLTYKAYKVDFIGTDFLLYTITDNRGKTATAKVTLNITKSTSQDEDSGEINKILYLLLFPLLIAIRKKEKQKINEENKYENK